jgi:hypothetical protein
VTDLLPITRVEILAELERELKMRREVFPRWVSAGKLKADVAERRIAIMEAVAAMVRAHVT